MSATAQAVPLVVSLLQRQRDRAHLTNAAFAEQVLGVSPAEWSLVQTLQRGIGKKFVLAILRAYPHNHPALQDICIACELVEALRQPYQLRRSAPKPPR